MCKDVGPGGFFPPSEPQTLLDPPTTFVSEQPRPEVLLTCGSDPQTPKILSKTDPIIFEVKCNDKRCRDKESEAVASGETVRGSGMWIPVQVENQPFGAIVDTGASRSLMSRSLASEIGNPILPYDHNLFGSIGNVIPIDGIMRADVKIGPHATSDEFIVVDQLYPQLLIGLKFMTENGCQMDLGRKKFLIKISDSKTIAVGVHIGDRYEHPPDDQAYVIQTVKNTENPENDDLNAEIENDVDEIMQLAASELQNAETKQKLIELVKQYRHVFALAKDPLGTAVGTEHRIETKDAPPIKMAPYNIAPHKLPAIRAEIQEMLERGVIVPSKSPFSSPIVMVPKKDGTNRMCIDYRKLNEITVKDAYPLPRIGQTIDALQGAGFFSSLDLANGYWQVPVVRDDRHKTAFCTPDGGLFEFVKMPFGLTNAPATFQRLMNNIFSADLFQHVLIFLDDVLTYSKTPNDQLHHLGKVFLTLRRAGLKLKPKKCNLFQTEVHYLGHVIDKGGIRPNLQKLNAVRNWERPKTVTQVRSFTAFCNYYRKFVKIFAEVAKPLYALTSKAVKFTWNEEHEKAFQFLKMRLLQAPILSFPNFSYPFVIDMDASETALGAVLSQVIEGEERPVAFESRVLTKTEVNYATTKREALGIVQAMQWFRPYIYGTQCIVRTDHASLQWLFRQNANDV